MDIIDIMLAKALTPQGQVGTYAAKALKASQDAASAAASASSAAQALENAAQTKSDAESALADVQAALTALNNAGSSVDIATVDTEVKKMTVNTNIVTGSTANTLQVITTYPDNTLNTQNITKLYKSTGQNEDGAMTQKAITDALSAKADSTALNNYASISYVTEAIANIPTSSNSSTTTNTDLGSANEGKIVVIGSDGNIISGTVTEDALIEALVLSGGYIARDAVGLEMDFSTKTPTRTQEANGKSTSADFDVYPMFGGRMRCNVADNGTINAFYGEQGYTEDGSNGQVMVYQPKFYYQRIPLRTTDNKVGKIIERDSLMVSYTPQNGFKVHPIFLDSNGNELDYVLFGAYEGGIYSASNNTIYNSVYTSVNFDDDKLTSIANTKPLTGTSSLTMQKAEQLATNRGSGWHIYTIQAESANQMLEVIEFGTFNGQAALGKGISNITTNGNYNQAAITGSTASLGNTSGSASSTTIETNGSTTTETENGKVSISYRGLENPWGNTWTMLGGIVVYGNTASNGGIPYICNNYNYSYSALSNNYVSAGFSLANDNGWVASFGYGSKEYDWLFMPAEVGGSANSTLPVGDNGWFDSNLTGLRMVAHGGGWSFEDSNGPFYYACDKQPTDSTYKSYGARLMFIPSQNSIYTANVAKWQAKMNIGG